MRNKEEFNLSDKRKVYNWKCSCGNSGATSLLYYPEEDVKEFIRLLKEKVLCYNESKELMLKELDKLAGEKLK